MIFNNYTGTGSIMSTDMHHPFENILMYTQVVELEQKLFSEYVPISGMYSIIHGIISHLFGNGQMSYYWLAFNIFKLLNILVRQVLPQLSVLVIPIDHFM